jgi:glutamate-1-semialdehyde-2,1-aminomutase
MTMTSTLGRALHDRAAQVIPGGVNSATRFIGEPYAFADAEGAHVVDADGRRYLDYHAAFGANLLGYRDPYVAEAVAAATQRSLIGLGVTELEIEVAELVGQLIPTAERSISTMSGTEATFQAIRLARGITGRDLIVKFQGCFHGWHDAVARNVISAPERAYGMDPTSSGILPSALEATLIAEFNDLASVQELFDRHPDRIAAVILEPVPHNVGTLLPEEAFLRGLRTLTAERGALLIFDEVISGFRHALGGWGEISGIEPDLTTFGKSMGNGVPIAGLAGPAAHMDQFSSAGGTVQLAGTFNGNPTSSAAAIATMTYLRDHPDFYERTHALGERMRSGLRTIADDLGIQARVAGYGGVFCMYFLEGEVRGYRDLMRDADEAYATFHRRMLDVGFLMLPMALKRNHISGAHTSEHIDMTLEAAEGVLRSMAQDGRLS